MPGAPYRVARAPGLLAAGRRGEARREVDGLMHVIDGDGAGVLGGHGRPEGLLKLRPDDED